LEQLKAQVDNGISADTAGLLMVQAIERSQFWVFLNAGDYYQSLDDQHAEIRKSSWTAVPVTEAVISGPHFGRVQMRYT
jgi:hypothetical protein